MIVKFKKKFLSVLSIALLSSIMTGTFVKAGDYDQTQDYNTLSTAFFDAMRDMQKEDGKVDGDKDKDKDSDSGKDEGKDEGKDKEKEEKGKVYAENFKSVMAAGNFGNTGILYGPVTVSKNNDATSVLANTNGLLYSGIKDIDDQTWSGGKVKAYYNFGRGISNLKQTAMKNSPAFLGFDKTVESFTKIATAISRAGIKLVNDYNPAPVLLAFYDSEVLTNKQYAGDNGNKLINLINGVPTLVEFIKFFGDKTAVGISFAMTMIIIVGILSIMFAVFGKIWNGKKSSIAVRRFIVRLLVGGVAFPVVCYLFSNALTFINDSLVEADKGGQQRIAETNLNLYDWYKNTGFALPPGVNLEVKNGHMQLTHDVIHAINKNSSKTAKTSKQDLKDDKLALSTSNPVELNKRMHQNGDQIVLQGDASDEEITNRLIEYGSKNKNSVDVSFLPPTIEGAGEGGNAQKFWGSGELQSIADKVGKNEKLGDELSQKLAKNKYLSVNGLTYDDHGDNFTFRYNQPGYGMSPIAAYNLLASEFDANGFQVNNNVKHVIIPAIVAGADSPVYKGAPADKNKPQMNAFVKFVAMMTICFAGFKALFDILSTGFGAVFRGGVGAAMGRSAAIGNIIGSLIVLVLGVIGLSILINLVLISMNYLYAMLDELLRGKGGVLDEASSAIKDIFNEIGWFGKFLNWAFKGIGDFVLLILIIMAFPKMLKIPITGYAEFLKGIPNMISERAARWEAQFVGDYHAGGMRPGRGAAGGSGVSSAFAGAKDQAKAMGVGAAMIAGGVMSSIGSKLSGESIGKDGDITNIDDDKSEALTMNTGNEIDNEQKHEDVVETTNPIDVEETTEGNQTQIGGSNNPTEKHVDLGDDPEYKDGGTTEINEETLEGGGNPPTPTPGKNDEVIAGEGGNGVDKEISEFKAGADKVNSELKDGKDKHDSISKELKGKDAEQKAQKVDGKGVDKPDADKHNDGKHVEPKVPEKDSEEGIAKPEETKEFVDNQSEEDVKQFNTDGTEQNINAKNSQELEQKDQSKSIGGIVNEDGDKVDNVEKVDNQNVDGDHLQTSKESVNSVAENTEKIANKVDSKENFNQQLNNSQKTSDVNFNNSKDDIKETISGGVLNEIINNPTSEKVEKPVSIVNDGGGTSKNSSEPSIKDSEEKSVSKVREVGNGKSSEIDRKSSNSGVRATSSGEAGKAPSGKPGNTPPLNNPLSSDKKSEGKVSKIRKATGRSMQAMGGYAHGDHQAKKQIAAGALHVMGGLSGTQKLTGKVAQKAIDSKNARLAQNGIEITSTLNADGVSDLGTIRRRAEGKAQKKKVKDKRKAEGKTLTGRVRKLTSEAVTRTKNPNTNPVVSQGKKTESKVTSVKNPKKD